MHAQLLTVEEALEQILSRAVPLPVETVALEEAAGRVLREPARARVDLPPFPSSAMDGFAVRAAETPGELPVAFRVPAGAPAPGPLPPGTVAGIATGGAVPEGADAVVPVERAEERDERVAITEPVAHGEHVRPRGGDVCAGDVVVEAGTRLAPQHVGALAAAGVAELRCSVQPRVAVLATGSELRPPGSELAAGQIYESNRVLLAAALAPVGARVELLPVVEDDPDAHRAALARGLEADVLVTSGGVSMGPHDLVRESAAALGVQEVFWGVAVKPGKPLAFGARGETLVFGLPGNPVSSLVGALVFVRPALLARQGLRSTFADYLPGRLASEVRRNPRRDEFVRARRRATPAGDALDPIRGQESHMIVRSAAADALVHVPRGEGSLDAGSDVRFIALD
jgi:molybdopterin molybdotransferase